MWSETLSYYLNTSYLEWLAVITALAYVVLAARENILCWPAALLSTCLYTYIFYEYYLWMDSVLQVYYFVMAVYGWYCWKGRHLQQEAVSLNQLSWGFHATTIVILSAVSVAVGYIMDNYTPTTFPYIDAATTVFAVFATYLVTQKVIENWLYWVVIDIVSIYVYLEKGLAPTAALFIVYVFIAAYGYINWQSQYKRQAAIA
ncbi:nicotinamide riboside transporter PnuC [Thalassotalea euphylliae]|uniref:nicotinamide riboside transporter PnuC n=1 Tax=Thalassotalea euphylliae TaxID=1655234 RepID=UPI0036276BF9